MTVTFANSPLVELIVELRWPVNLAIGLQVHASGFVGSQTTDDGGHEELYMRFGAELYQLGFQRSERLVPQNFSASPHQVAVRFRKDGGSTMFQIGPGVFTANAIQPYKSWQDFAPVVRDGIECLLRAKPPVSGSLDMASMKYVDAFTEAHLQGMSHEQFIKEVLGFNIGVPAVIEKYLSEGGQESALQKRAILNDGSQFFATVGTGVAGSVRAVILDLMVNPRGPIPLNVDEIMSRLEAARDTLHDMFVEMTKPIHPILKPELSK